MSLQSFEYGDVFKPFKNSRTITFVSPNLRSTSGAQSLASLMNAFVKLGFDVNLITYTKPSGDDYISNIDVTRYSLDYYENNGYTCQNAFFKLAGAVGGEVVVFTGMFDQRTAELYQAARRLGRCIVIAQDRSPFISLAAGADKLFSETVYMYQNADLVIASGETEEKIFRSMGVRRCVCLPFYFPYYDSEVGAAGLTGRHVIFYTTYAGRNVHTVLNAFARVHEKYPDATMHLVGYNGIRRSGVMKKLVESINASQLSDCVTAEEKVLKPLRYLREADISITYGHLIHMPEPVMESVSAGIPALLLQDADFSGDSGPVVKINAADSLKIEQALEHFMDRQNRLDYQRRARAVLDPDEREKLALRWACEIGAALSEFNSSEEQLCGRLDKTIELVSEKKSAGVPLCEIVKALELEHTAINEALAAMILCGCSIKDISDALTGAFIYASYDERSVRDALELWRGCKKIYSGKSAQEVRQILGGAEVIQSDIALRLALSGFTALDISAALSGVNMSLQQTFLSLCSSLPIADPVINTLHLGFDMPPAPADPGALTVINSTKAFMLENSGLFRYSKLRFVRFAQRIARWYCTPFAEMSVKGKIVALPMRIVSRFKKAVTMHGRRRLSKRKVVEVKHEDVRKIQLMVLEMMLEFERICKKHNLRYYLAGGTILGGIRHKGFIPWDDDMDITMPRPDYEKFLKIAQKELDKKFILENDCVPYCHNRIEIRGTKFITQLRNGRIFLDILALEGCPDDEEKRLEHEAKCKFWRTCMLEKARPLPALTFNKVTTKLYIKRIIFRLTPRRFLKWRWHYWWR